MLAISTRRAAASMSLLAAAALFAGCSDSLSTPPAVPTLVTAESAPQFSMVVGTTAADSLKVQVTTNNATLAGGVTVEWTVVSGDGTVSAPTSVTNANGEAAVVFKAGTKVGTSEVNAKISGVDPAVFDIKQEAAGASGATVVDGLPTSTALDGGPVSLQVEVVDAFGNPVSGQTVFWTVTGGAGSFDFTSSISDASGIAYINFTPSGSPGPRTIEARTGDGISADIALAVTPPAQ